MNATTAPVLSPADVERLELATRADLVSGIGNLTRLRVGSAHITAGFTAWHEYALARFSDLLAELRLTMEERRALVLSMRLGDGVKGASQRTIARRLGVGLGTVAEDIIELRRAGLLDNEPAKVESGDGKDRPARGASRPGAGAATLPLEPPTGLVYQQAAEWLRRADAGLVVHHGVTLTAGLSLVELAAVAGWTEGKASGALSYLTRASHGWAVRLEDVRAGQRIHVLTAGGRVMLADLAAAAATVEDPVLEAPVNRFVGDSGDLRVVADGDRYRVVAG